MRQELQKAIQLLRNDPAGVPHAIRLLQGTVFSFSMKLCGHREDAEDTMQDVLVSALPYLAKIEDPRALSVWLYTAARNRCWRKRKKESSHKTVALEDLMPDGAELSALLTAAAASPEQKALTQEDQLRVHEAVLQLPPQYRLVLVLHDMEELDTEEVAAVLSLQPGTVRVRLHRARLLLRKELEKLHRGPETSSRRKKQSGAKRPRECMEIFGNLSEYLDGRMERKSCKQMRAHIDACPACIAFLSDLKLAIDRCRKLKMPFDGDTCSSLRRLLAEEYVRLLQSRSSGAAKVVTS
ncbi:MAG: sigma-70 family RNA polymerase sigma factor [Acidobacteriaceae bacterium]|jgi:RNA polymerase sigma-70 factor, ECF subfamily